VHRGSAQYVEIELDTRAGLPSFALIGLAGGLGRDARERVQAALLNSGFSFPRKRVTVNITPTGVRKTGTEFDLALACCVLAAQGDIDAGRLARVGLFAELGLAGDLRSCASPGEAAQLAEQAGLAGLVVAHADVAAACELSQLAVAGLGTLGEVVALLAPAAPRSTRRRRAAGGRNGSAVLPTDRREVPAQPPRSGSSPGGSRAPEAADPGAPPRADDRVPLRDGSR
jgi:magnesium chelatase family protein